jgi:hypothetical protein
MASRFGIEFDARKGSEEYYDRIRKIGIELEKAAAAAVNDTADEVLRGLRVQISESLDDPTDFTLDAFAATKARPGGSPAAQIYVKPEQYSYLKYQMEGGVEHGGGRYDDLIGGDMLVPGRGADLDEHGNFPSGYLESVEANGGWWMKTRSGRPGLFRRNPYGKIEAIALATDGIVYKRRLVVDDEVEETVNEVLPEALGKAIAAAVK